MSDQLINSQDSHHFDQTDYLSCLPDDLEVLQPLQEEREEERNDGEEVDHVHGAADEFKFARGAGQSDEILHGKETDSDNVDHVDDLQEDAENEHILIEEHDYLIEMFLYEAGHNRIKLTENLRFESLGLDP